MNPLLKPLIKKSKKGLSGYPIATLAFYGPDDKRASKAVIAIIPKEDGEPADMKKWFSEEDEDLRLNKKICADMIRFVKTYSPKSVVLADKIMGCPHQEGIDYPENQECPNCEFWMGKNRWTGQQEH